MRNRAQSSESGDGHDADRHYRVLDYLLGQPVGQAGADKVDVNIHLLLETHVQVVFPDLVAMPVAGSIGLSKVLDRIIFSGSFQGILRAFQPKLSPFPAQFPIVQQQSLPEVEGHGGYLAQDR